MPHIVIEYPADAAGVEQVEAMLDAVHQAIVASGLFEEGHIKLRAIPLRHYRLGGARHPFLHAQLRIHRGRSEEQRQMLSHRVLESLRDRQWPLQVITVEVVEMERASYAKCSLAQDDNS